MKSAPRVSIFKWIIKRQINQCSEENHSSNQEPNKMSDHGLLDYTT